MADTWARLVGRYRLGIVVGWLLVAIGSRLLAPSWDQVAFDGDFDYLPATMSSVAGGRLLDEAFPGDRARSQVVLFLGREYADLNKRDELVGLDLLRRLHHRLAEVSWQRAISQGYVGGEFSPNAPWAHWIEVTEESLNNAIDIDQQFYDLLSERLPETEATLDEPRLAIAYWDRAILRESLKVETEKIASDYEAALVLYPGLPKHSVPVAERDLSAWSSLLDVLSWDDAIIGQRLKTDGARLAVLQLSSELAATENIATIEAMDELVARVQAYSGRFADPGLEVLKTGSAAIGGETLIAARAAIQYTEWFTVILILTILAIVYRAPFLVAVPMISIFVAVVTSTALVTWLTQASANHALMGLDLRVFTTSRIFVVVILFGAGTDYCLFLIARLREEAAIATTWGDASHQALSGVSGALIGSALTTIVGLGMLWIAEFGKFHYTGPIIGLCLSVGLLVCMTFTPALLHVLGPRVFWPSKIGPCQIQDGANSSSSLLSSSGIVTGFWPSISLFITRRPMPLLVVGVGVLLLPAMYGWRHEDSVTYDLSSELGSQAESRRGLQMLQQHFSIGEINDVRLSKRKRLKRKQKNSPRVCMPFQKLLRFAPQTIPWAISHQTAKWVC
jgi:putative drug exporter of the RND superfamily